MTIKDVRNGEKLTVAPVGRLDSNSAPQLEEMLHGALDGVTELVFDLAELEYVSSAGLRVLLMAQRTMKKQGSMVVRNAGASLMDVFEVTGFTDVITFA